MADVAVQTYHSSISALDKFSDELAETIKELEERTDHYEDILGSYLVKLSAHQISQEDNAEATMLLKAISDFERIGDHAKNIMESAAELNTKKLSFSPQALEELGVITSAIQEILELSIGAFVRHDLDAAYRVEPLEDVIDDLKEQMRTRHILRLQQGICSIETGFIWSDLLTALERTGDHCSNIAGCILDLHNHNMNTHEAIRSAKLDNASFTQLYTDYADKYHLA